MKKANLYKILFLILYWVSCTIFIVFYESSLLGFNSEIEAGNYSFIRILLIAVIICIIGATILGTIDVFYLSRFFRRKSFGVTILIRSTIYFSFILVFTSVVRLIITSTELSEPFWSKNVLDIFADYLTSPRVIMAILYWGIACVSALFLLQVNEKFGQGVLINFLRGKYHRPKEEERIFMFMDLKSSTTYAEQLGHITYSQLIQDCFYDLTDIVLKYNAFIYQYVGDEVVLSWTVDKGIKNCNCLKLFYSYDKELNNRKAYYKNKYNMIPDFKAGLDLGFSTVAEIGQIKKELAFHGDVLNTASRIQGKCNELQKRLLISESLKKRLGNQNLYDFNAIGDVDLRGKTKPVKIFDVNPIT